MSLSGLAACTTTAPSTASDTVVPSGASASGVVVSQIGAKDPVLAPHPRQFYLDERQAQALLPRTRGALATGEAADAVGMAKAKLAQSPGDPTALMLLSAALALSHNYELAAYYAGVLERVQPGNAFALNVKGIAAMLAPRAKVADYKSALDYFQKAMDVDATQVAAGLNLGSLQLELGNATAAAGVFQVVAERCGQCVAGQLGYGRALARSEQYPAAAAVFKEILAKHPKNATAMYNLALVYKNGFNDKKQAESYLTAVIHDEQSKDAGLKDRAQIMLRSLAAQKSSEERTRIADKPQAAPQGKAAADDKNDDAEILMSTSPAEGEDP